VAGVRGEQYLTKPAQYGLVYSKGTSWSNYLLVMKALPNGLDLSRYGFSVSKRVGNAVVRNKAKRRLREILRRMPLLPGRDMIFIVRTPAGAASFADLEKAVRALLSRARLLTEDYEKTGPKAD
jgi:ribonuclease P protein component